MAMRIPCLATERLIIREFAPDDLDTIHRILSDGFGGVHPLPERQQWLQWAIMNYRELDKLNQPPYGDRAVVRKTDDRLIGATGLVPAYGPFGQLSYFTAQGLPEDRRYRPEVGLFWVIDPGCQGHGYATEAARAMIDHAFSALNLSRIVAETDYNNAASIGVMRKLGMNIQNNPYPDPVWFQVTGILENPKGT
jgi:RimJ/RimL family protein N-acetyltransferase